MVPRQRRQQPPSAFLNESGIPISFINEGLHGGAPGGTIFPMPIAQGCSWNVSLVSKIARVIATEARSIGVDTVFAPVVNMNTDPRFGASLMRPMDGRLLAPSLSLSIPINRPVDPSRLSLLPWCLIRCMGSCGVSCSLLFISQPSLSSDSLLRLSVS